jgi:hypothetical protein
MGSDDAGLLVLAAGVLLVLAADELLVLVADGLFVLAADVLLVLSAGELLVLAVLVLEHELSGGCEWGSGSGTAGSYDMLLSAWRHNLDLVVLFWRRPISVHAVGIVVTIVTIVVVGYRGVVGGVLQY